MPAPDPKAPWKILSKPPDKDQRARPFLGKAKEKATYISPRYVLLGLISKLLGLMLLEHVGVFCLILVSVASI